MLIQILVSVILPIFLIVGVGWLLDRVFRLDLPTLSRLNFYVFVPALMFVLLLDAKITARGMLSVGLFTAAQMALLFGLAWLAFAHRALRPRQTVMTLGVVLNNCGNFGIPLVLLAFKDQAEQAVGVLIVIIMVQNIFTFTGGIWLMERRARAAGSALAQMAKIPTVYAILLALAVRWLAPRVPAEMIPGLLQTLAASAMVSVRYLGDGLIAIALLTLGVQLSRARLAGASGPVAAVTAARLLIAPLLAAALVPLFHLTPPVSSVLIVAAGFPVAVNLTILSAEYRQDEDLASQSIFLSTLASGLTLTILLALVK